MRTTDKRSARRIAGVAGVGLVAASLPLMTAGSAQAANVTIQKDYLYQCHTVAAGLNLGNQAVGVNEKVVVPSSISAGGTVGPRKTQITLTLPESLRSATYGLLSARTAGGYSKDTKISITAPGAAKLSIPINNLSAPQTTVPPNAGDPWLIPTVGNVPAIKIPAGAHGTATLKMPTKFTIIATLKDAAGNNVGGPDAVTMNCVLDTAGSNGDGVIGTIAVKSAAASRIRASASRTVYGSTTRVSYSLTPKASGSVRVSYGSRVLKTGSIKSGKGSVTVPARKLAPGSRTLKVAYLGGSGVKPSATSTKVTVVKAAPGLATKVKPKKIKAKKTHAKVTVKVKARGVTPTGSVKVYLGKKKVGAAKVKHGKATVKLKTFKKKGKATLKVKYSGSKYVKAKTKKVKVKVKK